MLARLAEKRVLMVTGKGGVGRSTVAAALAVAAARRGKRTLLLEIGTPKDGHSSLARLFGRDRFHPHPERLAGSLQAGLVWSRDGHRAFLKTVLPVPPLVAAAMRSSALDRLLDAAPSFNEMGVFYRALSLAHEKTSRGDFVHELLVVDMPATGHTLAITELPDILLSLLPTGPFADAMHDGQALLYDPRQTNAVVVTLPETLPVTESLELMDGLRRTRVPIGCVIVNRTPAETFDDDEHIALASFLADHEVLGANRYRALRKAEHETERVARGGAPVLPLPELQLHGRPLVDGLAATLEDARPM